MILLPSSKSMIGIAIMGPFTLSNSRANWRDGDCDARLVCIDQRPLSSADQDQRQSYYALVLGKALWSLVVTSRATHLRHMLPSSSRLRH